jgi:hypothetical protein
MKINKVKVTTVAELIEKLSKYNKDMPVFLLIQDSSCFGELGASSLQDIKVRKAKTNLVLEKTSEECEMFSGYKGTSQRFYLKADRLYDEYEIIKTIDCLVL